MRLVPTTCRTNNLEPFEVREGDGFHIGRGKGNIEHLAISRQAAHVKRGQVGGELLLENTGRYPLLLRRHNGEVVRVQRSASAHMRDGDVLSLLDPRSNLVMENFPADQDPHSYRLEVTGTGGGHNGEPETGSKRKSEVPVEPEMARRSTLVFSPDTSRKDKVSRHLNMDDVSDTPSRSYSSACTGESGPAGEGMPAGVSCSTTADEVAAWILDVTSKAAGSSGAREALENNIQDVCVREDINGSVVCELAQSLDFESDFKDLREMLEGSISHKLSHGVASCLKMAFREIRQRLSHVSAVGDAPNVPTEVKGGGESCGDVGAGGAAAAGPKRHCANDEWITAKMQAESDHKLALPVQQEDDLDQQHKEERAEHKEEPRPEEVCVQKEEAKQKEEAAQKRETEKKGDAKQEQQDAADGSGAHKNEAPVDICTQSDDEPSQATQAGCPCELRSILAAADGASCSGSAVESHCAVEPEAAAEDEGHAGSGSDTEMADVGNKSDSSNSSHRCGKEAQDKVDETHRGGSKDEQAPQGIVIVLNDSDDEEEEGACGLNCPKTMPVSQIKSENVPANAKYTGAPNENSTNDDLMATQEQEKLEDDDEDMMEEEEAPLEIVATEQKQKEANASETDMIEDDKKDHAEPSPDMMEEDAGPEDEGRASGEAGEGGRRVEKGGCLPDPKNEEELAEQVFQQMNDQRDLTELGKDADKRLNKKWFTVELKEHQKQGLGWMLSVEERRNYQENKFPSGGILADTMGLGKTLTLLSLVATTASEESNDRVPYFQRKREGKKLVCWCKDEIDEDEVALKCSKCSQWFHIYNDDCSSRGGSQPQQRFSDVEELITCKRFCYICKECSSKATGSDSLDAPFTTLVVVPTGVASQWREEVEAKAPDMRVLLYYGTGKKEYSKDAALFHQFDVVITTYGSLNSECPTEQNKWHAGPLFRIKWRRVALDEAHQIRNKGTKACLSCKTLEAQTYWCMTGTPVVNRLTDFEAYALFICNQIEDWAWLPKKLKNVCNAKFSSLKNDALLAKNVQELLIPILLRRTKDDKIDGEKIIQLPEKVVIVKDDLVLSDRESVLYGRLESGFKMQFNSMVKKGYKANMMNILCLLMRLRQFCNHPGLLPADMLKALIQQDDEEGGGEVDGGSSESESEVAKTEGAVDGAGKEEKEKNAKKKSWSSNLARRASAAYGDVLSQSQSQSQAPAGEEDEEDGGDGDDGRKLDVDNLEDVEARMIADEDGSANSKKDKEDNTEYLFLGASTKAIAVAEEIQSMLSEDSSIKILVFCMFPRFFGMLKDTEAFKDNKIPHLCIDGGDGLEARGHKVAQFKKDHRIRVFLMSTKCCCHGLNLTIACRGIIVDPWWNSGSEEQAVDRMHRMGQINIVKVTKFIVSGTVEERMYIIQQEKAKMAAIALGEAAGGMSRRKQNLSLDDLKKLFGSVALPHPQAGVGAGVFKFR